MYWSTHTIQAARSLLLMVFCISIFTLFVSPAQAQISTIGGVGLLLIAKPTSPAPYTDTTISIDDYSINAVGSSIYWYVNDREEVSARNERSLKVTTGGLGERTVVKASLSRPNSPPISKSITLVPVQIDLITEASTYVPDFYQGRALPTSGSPVRFTAVVNDGTETPNASYVFKWTLGENVLFGGPKKGGESVEVEMPQYDDEILSVEIIKDTGETVGELHTFLKTNQPELHFYEHSPLRGLREREIVSPLYLIAEETTIYGEPYFLDARMDEKDATFTWKIDYEEAAHDAEAPNALTLRHVGGAGESTVQFSAVTTKSIFQFVENSIQLIFQ